MNLILLACLAGAIILGLRIGYAIARRHNTREKLHNNVLREEYGTLYEDMCYADKLLHDIYDALMNKDSNGICQFVEDFQEWNGTGEDKIEE